MNYNVVVIISMIICVIISLLLSYGITVFLLDENSVLFKVSQLVLTIVSMTTLYSPIKFALLKYMKIEEFENENENN